MAINFNESTQQQRFIYKPHESEPHVWVIFEYKTYKGPKGGYDAVGDYRLIATDENPEVTIKKLEAICRLLDGKQPLENFGNLTESRLLFNIKKKEDVNDPTVMTFRTHDGTGVSQENAVLTVEKGVLHE
ncbi:MAG: hypothetical protein LRZ85_10345 [Alphaproteobacteria bacterium]|nr:hypothetical protein [Alphaproteobacteria bacterium]MCD8520599.1 hypothetical protein [Alphaproteobacteria bacterium]MCD8526216.1 hypothetical protein [Alphaproteobacteria bacterium]MCD8571408.1 hypothetical protein [Alphaproteobacteria bacterium]